MIYLFLIIESCLVLLNNIVSFYFSIAIFEDTNSSSMMAISIFIAIAPTIYLSFIAGRIVDRIGRSQVIISCSLLLLFVYLFLAIYSFEESLTITLIFLFIFIRAAISSFHDIAIMAWIPEKVEEKNLRIAYGFQGFFNKGALIIGPVLAGIIYNDIDSSSILIVSAIFSVASLWLALVLAEWNKGDLVTKKKIDIRSCLSFLADKPKLKASLFFFCAFNTANGIASAFLVAYVLMVFGSYEQTLSLYNFLVAVGTLAGTLYSIKKLSIEPLFLIGLTTLFCALLGRFAISFTASLVAFSIFVAVRSALIPIGNMANQILWVEQTEKDSRASLFGFRRLIGQGVYPVSILMCAILIDYYELSSDVDFLKGMFIVSGIFEMLLASILIVYSRKINTLCNEN